MVTNIGSVKLLFLTLLTNILHVLGLSINLISLHQLIKDLGQDIIFSKTACFYHHKVLGQLTTLAKVGGGLYLALASHRVHAVDVSPPPFSSTTTL